MGAPFLWCYAITVCVCSRVGAQSYPKLFSQYLARMLSLEILNSILELIQVHNLILKILTTIISSISILVVVLLLISSRSVKHSPSIIQNLNWQYELLSFYISHSRHRDLLIPVYFFWLVSPTQSSHGTCMYIAFF